MTAGPATFIAEAELFLYRHPWSTTDVDNPVELLRGVVDEAEQLIEQLDAAEHQHRQAMQAEPEALTLARAQIAELVTFIRGLHGQGKISDFEMQAVRIIAKTVPSHCAVASSRGGQDRIP